MHKYQKPMKFQPRMVTSSNICLTRIDRDKFTVQTSPSLQMCNGHSNSLSLQSTFLKY
jgi:hypothetical protein